MESIKAIEDGMDGLGKAEELLRVALALLVEYDDAARAATLISAGLDYLERAESLIDKAATA